MGVEMWTPTEVAERCRTTRKTVREWITAGVKLPDGTRVRLRAERVGGRWRIEPPDVAAFVKRCTKGALPADDGAEVAGHPVPSKADRRRTDEALARLKAKGIG